MECWFLLLAIIAGSSRDNRTRLIVQFFGARHVGGVGDVLIVYHGVGLYVMLTSHARGVGGRRHGRGEARI